jgi:IclR family acetate operon transcriptional repressor
VAAPVLNGDVTGGFSVGATGPVRRFTDARRSKVGMELKKLAARLGTAITLSSS